MSNNTEVYIPKNKIRVITATSLFDGHDVSINIFRRILQASGAEVIHLGHNRSVEEIVDAAIEEDVNGVAVSSYQGGHNEFFKYMIDLLEERKASHIRVFCGGGGVIVPEEIQELELYGVTKVYTPEDGSIMGLQGIVNHMIQEMDYLKRDDNIGEITKILKGDKLFTASCISFMECAKIEEDRKIKNLRDKIREKALTKKTVVIGITGTGGAGKSSLTDEIVLRLLFDNKDIKIAVISADPSRRKSGGALLGDRIRMNSIDSDRVYMRSVATRLSQVEVPDSMNDFIAVAKVSGYDLIIVETAGIGQGNSNIVDLVDLSIYVMTSDFGAASQLEKIDMLDFADIVVVNKYEKVGSEDAVRDVRKQVQRNLKIDNHYSERIPVFGTIASKFNDDGVTALYYCLLKLIHKKRNVSFLSNIPEVKLEESTSKTVIIPPERVRYLSEIAEKIRKYHSHTQIQAKLVREWWHLNESIKKISKSESGDTVKKTSIECLENESSIVWNSITKETKTLLKQWKTIRKVYSEDELKYNVREQEIRVPLFAESLARNKIPKIALPKFEDFGEIYTWLRKENLPGYFPYTAGVFPIKRLGEDPTRMFAGEGDPERTNRRFKLLSSGSKAKRLSTAFDSVTLYGCDPDRRPDIYGKIGNSGVSVCSLDDIKVLYEGFELCSPSTSVSMTINGPAPIILAMFFNTAIDQQIEKYESENNQEVSNKKFEEIKTATLQNVRGTVQADILKEDQGQNTCIFSTDFALKMMADIQEYFITKGVNKFYSVSISGYHIAEAGANPITQLAFTLANGFTYLEYYLSRGMPVDKFASNLSFFFSNGMDPEYTVIGRVARRIWSIALKEKYGASLRSQLLKYHIQTSGRSLHSQNIQFNDVRTTLQALCAVYDNCNSLHTNAFDEAITTPTEDSVRRALAIQMIINREWGLAKNENPYQGSFIVDELTDLVEEAVLMEYDNISARGGVLGAMETGYQRSKIQEESMYYESLKHEGKIPIVGVNVFKNGYKNQDIVSEGKNCVDLARATVEEKESQLKRLANFKNRNLGTSDNALKKLQKIVLENQNIFEELMNTVRFCSLGQITAALYEVGGRYRRNM